MLELDGECEAGGDRGERAEDLEYGAVERRRWFSGAQREPGEEGDKRQDKETGEG